MGYPSGTTVILMTHPSYPAVRVDVPAMVEDANGDPVDIAAVPAALAAHIARLEADGNTILKSDATGADLPDSRAGQSRKFRNCWRWDSTKIETDLPMARAEIMAVTRTERNEKLIDSDGKQLKVNETGSAQDQTDWETHRQALRDLPATVQTDVDALTTAADLEAHAVTWPTEPTA